MIIIERYLFLLEDAEYDELDKKWKELRKKVMKLGSGPDGGDRLTSLYPDKNKRPPDVVKKIRDYEEAVKEFNEASEKREKYFRWMSDGKQGPKPGSKNYDNRARQRSKMKSSYSRTDKIVFGIWISLMLYNAFKLYKDYLKTSNRRCGHLTGKEKIICENELKIQALRKQIIALEESKSKVNKTDDPKKALKELNLKIQKLKVRIIKLEMVNKKLIQGLK